MVQDRLELLDRDAEVLPYLKAADPVAHQVTTFDDEVLALAPLGLGDLVVVVAQREPPECDMPGLVLHHVGEDLLRQRHGRGVPHEPERCKGEPLDQHLHAQVRHVPPGVAEGLGEQFLQLVVDRIDQADLLLQEPGVKLHVACLVHYLGRAVELGVEVRDRLDDPRRADQRALLAVQELRELP